MSTTSSWHIRPATTGDRAFTAGLATRLLVGTAPWRGSEALLATFRTWLVENVDGQNDTAAAFVAESPSGTPVGVIKVSAGEHFSGEPQAEIGELVVDEEAEGQGVGSALLEAAETWARARLPLRLSGHGSRQHACPRFLRLSRLPRGGCSPDSRGRRKCRGCSPSR